MLIMNSERPAGPPHGGGERCAVGLAAFCAQWFAQVGIQSEKNAVGAQLRQDHDRIVEFLRECFDEVAAPGVITTAEAAARAAAEFRARQVAAIVVVDVFWSEDQPLVALLDGCSEVPLILWNYHPTGRMPAHLTADDLFRFSGTVGLLQNSVPLQRRNAKFCIVAGTPGSPALRDELRQHARALQIVRGLRGAVIGRIGGPCPCMTGTRADADVLHSRLGLRLREISSSEYAAACRDVAGDRQTAMCGRLQSRYPVQGVNEKTLRLACRNTLALDDLAAEHGLSALAIQDLDEELHRLAGIRPCLCPPAAAERGVAFGMEGDVNATAGMLVAMRASGEPCLFGELFTYDPVENLLLMGHAGVQDPRLAAEGCLRLVPDAEYRNSDTCEGAWQEFIMAAGPVTCASLYDTGAGYRLTVFEGESVGAPCRLDGFAHALVRLDQPVEPLISRLVERGMMQHFAVARGRLTGILAKWCKLGGVEFWDAHGGR